ncbi:Crp/Fnr family transcriptional regulator [Pseudodesulfovibrio piezophilus]|uniref:Putative transcriptional regulator, Crp/Fnr family n=1 Tax=Pseudodesulfovibrio piezophilus (strain DSM 21447 / JCM 15486 / C1TLV30) TaxID=1322246 RepID=M1WJX6_PSEP2|nr:cyclic nucleotide-binding domain-containing protein [Pseudodesulfovibrio piezophilus]CCH48651.1 putative transcriptional regulator, Crp/Fnr family [Pseudodesulfovibrio piezophilus C1TLV30]
MAQQSIQMKQVSRGNYLMRSVLKHNVIFNEGTSGDAAYILTEGKIEISGIMEGHKKVFAVLTPISIFGEMALVLDEGIRTATAIALEDSKVIVVTKNDLLQFMNESPKVISAIITVLVSRLKSTTKKAMKVPSIGMGVVRTLDLFAINGVMKIKYDTTVKSLADTFVTTPENIESYIHGLADQKLLVVGRDRNDTRIIRLRERNLLREVLTRKN